MVLHTVIDLLKRKLLPGLWPPEWASRYSLCIFGCFFVKSFRLAPLPPSSSAQLLTYMMSGWWATLCMPYNNYFDSKNKQIITTGWFWIPVTLNFVKYFMCFSSGSIHGDSCDFTCGFTWILPLLDWPKQGGAWTDIYSMNSLFFTTKLQTLKSIIISISFTVKFYKI